MQYILSLCIAQLAVAEARKSVPGEYCAELSALRTACQGVLPKSFKMCPSCGQIGGGASTDGNLGAITPSVYLKMYGCILAQGGSCNAAIKALVAQKNVPACKDSAEKMEKDMKICNSDITKCPELTGLETCFRGFMETPAKPCAVIKGASCNAGVRAIVAKKTITGCKNMARSFEKNIKLCNGAPDPCNGHGKYVIVGKRGKRRRFSYCICNPGRSGIHCESVYVAPCSGHGQLTRAGKKKHRHTYCVCNPGWTGQQCESEIVVVHGRHLRHT